MTRKNKFDVRFKPYYRIIQQTGPVSYIIKNKLDGSTSKVYAGEIRHAHIDEWQIAKDTERRCLRNAAYAIPPQASDSETSDSESEENIPLARLAQKYRKERETSSDEEDIPLMELRKRLRYRDNRQREGQGTEVKDMDCNDELYSDNSTSLPFVSNNDSDGEMEVNEVRSQSDSMQRKSIKLEEEGHQEPRSQKGGVKELLRLISNML